MGNELLRIYMNDQLALGTAWRELARRSLRRNRGTSLGEFLERLASEIQADLSTFEEIMERLDIPRSPVKRALAIAGERIGRLKLNGRVREYSPLSRAFELEWLALGLDGKRLLWANLRDGAGLGSRLPDIDFDHLIERAERQRSELEEHRTAAARLALRP